jgi:hypothetical protein
MGAGSAAVGGHASLSLGADATASVAGAASLAAGRAVDLTAEAVAVGAKRDVAVSAGGDAMLSAGGDVRLSSSGASATLTGANPAGAPSHFVPLRWDGAAPDFDAFENTFPAVADVQSFVLSAAHGGGHALALQGPTRAVIELLDAETGRWFEAWAASAGAVRFSLPLPQRLLFSDCTRALHCLRAFHSLIAREHCLRAFHSLTARERCIASEPSIL